jgi:SAM-dependent methyltransferase
MSPCTLPQPGRPEAFDRSAHRPDNRVDAIPSPGPPSRGERTRRDGRGVTRAGPPVYDRIGAGYTATRRPDPRIALAIDAALGDARTVVNVGAGAGAYEPRDRRLVAVEPSRAMIGQRPRGAAPCVQGAAERLPFRDRAVDACLAVLTLHHWTDPAAGLAELRRVARRRVVVLTWDPASWGGFWLTVEYFPEILDLPRFRSMAALERSLGPIRVVPVPIPHDCSDGFLGAFWRRPEAYLDPAVRRAMSGFAQLDPAIVARGIARLRDDLRSGRWQARHGALQARESLDLGYRLVVAERA